ncbi:helix-turn-helix domain-containing protein [Kribbella deserti]|uniref:Helix-turn-helix domain-containing protein n=1 Tax=Kribbella deserti TaxID=1926257 RepID=A0ABV6QNA3_9ACTN
MGRLWDLIQHHIDSSPYPPSERQVALKLGVPPTLLRKWKELKRLPSRDNLEAIADLVGVRYAVVLEAALYDTGYHEGGGGQDAPRSSTPMNEAALRRELEHAQADLEDWEASKRDTPGGRRLRENLRRKVSELEAQLATSQTERNGSDSPGTESSL